VIREATAQDLPVVQELWRAFSAEVPDGEWRDSDVEEDVAALENRIGSGSDVVLLAEQDGATVGMAVAEKRGERLGFLDLVYVRPDARRSGVAAELVREAASQLRERGVDMLELEVLASNGDARAVYERWGFHPVELTLAAPVDALVELLGRAEGPTFGSVHVQTDDRDAIERATQKVMPRLGRTAGTTVSGPRNGWIAVHDELIDREPKLLQRLAKELSYATGGVVLAIGVEHGAVVHYTLFDRGGAVDEYVSVPEYGGALPPGEVIALGANPTVVARLTGAQPARLREVARTATSPAELPPATELVETIAEMMGVSEAGHGWENR
jgi:ribosomal protein S18 acetylase RimI-like enzyme